MASWHAIDIKIHYCQYKNQQLNRVSGLSAQFLIIIDNYERQTACKRTLSTWTHQCESHTVGFVNRPLMFKKNITPVLAVLCWSLPPWFWSFRCRQASPPNPSSAAASRPVFQPVTIPAVRSPPAIKKSKSKHHHDFAVETSRSRIATPVLW